MRKRKGEKKYFLESKIKKFVNAEIKPHWGFLWGQKHWCITAYCGIIEGDGKQVVWLKTGDSRPNYYIMRIDSKTDIERDNFNPELLYCGVEEIFDNVDDFEEEYFYGELKVRRKNFGEEEEWQSESARDFPTLSIGNGAWWGIVKNFGL